MDAQAGGNPGVTDAQARRVVELRRAYQRQLRRRPTTLQRTLIDRACRLTAMAERAAADPTMPLNDVVRVDNLASRARIEARAAIAAPKPKSTLAEYLARTAEVDP